MNKLSKRLQHWYWKAETFGKNCMMAAGSILFFAACIVASSFGFWVQVKVAEFLFG